MKKIIALLLLSCMLLSMVACAQQEQSKKPDRVDPFETSEDDTSSPDVEESSEAPDTSEPPAPVSYAEKAEKYLEEKYQKEFTLENDYGQLMEFATPGVASNIKVATLGYIRKDNTLDWSLYTTEFVDDGYVIFNQDKLVEYFDAVIGTEYGNTELAVTYSAIAMPSSVTLDTPVEDVQAMTDRACFKVSGVCDENVGDILDKTKQLLKEKGYPVEIVMSYMPAANAIWDEVKHMTPEQLYNTVSQSKVVHTFAAHLSSFMQTAEEYLEQKYGYDFKETEDWLINMAGYQAFTAEGIDGNIIVAAYETISQMSGFDPALFTEAYADNGYAVINKEAIEDYYEQFIGSAYGKHKLIIQFISDVLPSNITPDMTFEEIVNAFPEATYHKVYLLAEKLPSKDEFAAMIQKMKENGLFLDLNVAQVESWLQEQYNLLSMLGLQFTWTETIAP